MLQFWILGVSEVKERRKEMGRLESEELGLSLLELTDGK
jgi:hypothetical protein